MSEIQDCMEDTSTEHETIEMLRTWKMDQLKEWILTRGLKRSGKKEVLVKRVYRVMQSGDDSSSDSASESDLHDTPFVTPINEVTEPWKEISLYAVFLLFMKRILITTLFTKNILHLEKSTSSTTYEESSEVCCRGLYLQYFFTMQYPRTLTTVT